LIQCKNLSTTIGVGDIKNFDSSIGRFPMRETLCIFVSNKKSPLHNNNKGFSVDAINWAKNSEYDILLTNFDNLNKDIIEHKFKYLTNNEEIEDIKETIKEIDERSETSIVLNKNLNKKIDNYAIIIISLIILLIIILLFK
jgi:hypothetical protein